MSKAVIALDIGYAHSGCACFRDYQPTAYAYFKTTPGTKKRKIRAADDAVARSVLMFKNVSQFIKDNEGAGVVCELPTSGGKSSTAVAAMSRAQAIVGIIVEVLQLPAEWVTPTDVKMAITGGKSASKQEMMDGVLALYPDVPPDVSKVKSKWEHIADAMGAFHAARDSNTVRLLMGGAS